MSGSRMSARPAMAAKNTNAGSQKTQSAVQANMQLRHKFINGSLFVKKTLQQVNIVAGTSSYSIPLSNQGALVGVDLEFSINITNGATASTPNPGCPYNILSNVSFVDQSNITRHYLSGQGLFDYLNFRRPVGAGVFGTSYTPLEGGGNYAGIAYPVAGNMAANATQTLKFLLHIPISKSKYNTTGMVLLQTGNQNQPAVINFTLSNLIGGQGNSPFNEPFTITGGSVIPHQLYWQPINNVEAPPIDTKVQWVLFETGQDTTNLSPGMEKQILFQMQFKTYGVGIRYFNGSTFSLGGADMTSVIEKNMGGTFFIDDTDPLLRYLYYRNKHSAEGAPGMYWFDYSERPLQYEAIGIYEADLTPLTVNAGAYTTQLYDWLKVPSDLLSLPGGSQIG